MQLQIRKQAYGQHKKSHIETYPHFLFFCSGREDSEVGGSKEGVPCVVYGDHYSGVLPAVLDAVQCCSHNGHVWSARNHHTHSERGSLSPSQEQHRH